VIENAVMTQKRQRMERASWEDNNNGEKKWPIQQKTCRQCLP